MNAKGRVAIVMVAGSERDELVRQMACSGFRADVFDEPRAYLNRQPASQSGCLLIDDDLPSMDGPELQRTLKILDDPTPQIVLSSRATPESTVAYLHNGATTLLTKPYSPSNLRTAVEAAVASEARTSEFRERLRRLQRCESSLTERERIVVDAVVRGVPNKRIARDLGVSLRTTENVRATAFRKFGVESAAELAARQTELRVLCELATISRNAAINLPPCNGARLVALAG